MGYYISNMIGIRTGGVFSDKTDYEAFVSRVRGIVRELDDTADRTSIDTINPRHCMSTELQANKGSYIVIAGVFNYWTFDHVSVFAKRLSEEFGTEVMLMSWDERRDIIQCQIYLDGKPLFEVNENPIGKVIRRTS